MEIVDDYPDQIRVVIDELVSHLDNNQLDQIEDLIVNNYSVEWGTKMILNLSPFQAYIVKNALRSYNTELLTSSDDWREFDNIFEQIADLSDTSRATIFNNDPYESPAFEYKQSKRIKHGKDLDSL